MFFVPKWLMYILIIAGIVLIFGGVPSVGIGFIIVGVIRLLIGGSGGNSDNSNNQNKQ